MIEQLLEQIQTRERAAHLLGANEGQLALRLATLQHSRLRMERLFRLRRPVRILATACWEFPIYSQTFVYQELAELARHGFELRFLYSKLNPRASLPGQFSDVWRAKRKLILHDAACRRDYAHYSERMPGKVEQLVQMLCSAASMDAGELRQHYHFRQAFAFTRAVEACGPDYLHSYFFYEGTLFTFVASYLLDIPRGVSCYADHMLDDYALKVVPLHLLHCDLVIATSARIKRELMAIEPKADAGRILVKPNAIDSRRFPEILRRAPAGGDPFRVVCVSRIEPKKGILYLVDAVDRLVKKGVNIAAHVLGGVDPNQASRAYAQAVEEAIRDRGIGGAFHLEGQRTAAEIRSFLESAHLFAAPFVETETGDKDGIPTALLEGMASGLPAVATDAGSITEVVGNGRDGIIVPQRDGAALSEAILALIANPVQRAEMGRAAAMKIRRSFDVSQCERPFHDRIRALAGRSKCSATGAVEGRR